MWIHKSEELKDIPEEYIGFVYCITNLKTDRKYIGKKLFKFTRTAKKKGRRVKKIIDSDWLTYYGSNKELNEHVALFGEKNFKREILYLCKNKSQMSYLELREQIDRRVLESQDYYNAWISAKIHKTKHLFNLESKSSIQG